MSVVKTKEELFAKVKEYMEIDGISRHEEKVAQALKANTKDTGVEYSRDRMGSIILNKKVTKKDQRSWLQLTWMKLDTWF